MSIPTIRSATPADEDLVVSAIVMAFTSDPVTRWIWPDPHTYLPNMPVFTRVFGGRALQHEGAYCSDDGVAAALWLPPDITPDEERTRGIGRTGGGPAGSRCLVCNNGRIARVSPVGALLVLALDRRRSGALRPRLRRRPDERRARALRPRWRHGLPRIHESKEHHALRTPRFRESRAGADRGVATIRSDGSARSMRNT